jgi:hypothetical protein
MLVTVTGFGSVWRHRFGKDENDSRRFARAAYFNTTGVPVNGTIRMRPKIAGHVRFNGIGGGFDPNRPQRMIKSTKYSSAQRLAFGMDRIRCFSSACWGLRSNLITSWLSLEQTRSGGLTQVHQDGNPKLGS